MKTSQRFMLVGALLVLVADQVTKYLVVSNLPPGGTWSSLPGPWPLFQIVHAYNTGAAFGLFKNFGVVFMVVAIVVIGAILFYARSLPASQQLIGTALGLMLGGSLGNLIDRLRLGQVLDFIDIGIGTTRWYTSNIADASIVLGVILLGISMLREEHRPKPATPGSPELPSA